jgi:haloalkane dehalogenase
VREYAREEPAIIQSMAFQIICIFTTASFYLSPPRRVVTFDFLGWGESDKPLGYAYTSKNQVLDLDAGIKQRKLGQVVLVAHDASGPPGIDWALNHSDQVAALVLLNTYTNLTPHPTDAFNSIRHSSIQFNAAFTVILLILPSR